MAKISVIVPVYNTGTYIQRCLESLQNQTVKEKTEIIVVNDGSTDNSEEIIKRYKSIKYYSKKNEGIAKTRNFGLEKASGDYILFVDSDDYIANNLVETLEPYMEKKIDVIKFKLQKVEEKGDIIEKVEGPVFDITTGEKAFHELFSKDVLIDSPCVYAIKKELFNRYNFQFRGTYHEDFGLIPIILQSAESVISINEYLYFYVQVKNSITRNDDKQKSIKRMKDVIEHYDNMLKIIEKLKLSKMAKEDTKIYYSNAVLTKLKELDKKDQKEFIKQVKERKFYKNIKVRNLRQGIKKILLRISIKLYLKVR